MKLTFAAPAELDPRLALPNNRYTSRLNGQRLAETVKAPCHWNTTPAAAIKAMRDPNSAYAVMSFMMEMETIEEIIGRKFSPEERLRRSDGKRLIGIIDKIFKGIPTGRRTYPDIQPSSIGSMDWIHSEGGARGTGGDEVGAKPPIFFSAGPGAPACGPPDSQPPPSRAPDGRDRPFVGGIIGQGPPIRIGETADHPACGYIIHSAHAADYIRNVGPLPEGYVIDNEPPTPMSDEGMIRMIIGKHMTRPRQIGITEFKRAADRISAEMIDESRERMIAGLGVPIRILRGRAPSPFRHEGHPGDNLTADSLDALRASMATKAESAMMESIGATCEGCSSPHCADCGEPQDLNP